MDPAESIFNIFQREDGFEGALSNRQVCFCLLTQQAPVSSSFKEGVQDML